MRTVRFQSIRGLWLLLAIRRSFPSIFSALLMPGAITGLLVQPVHAEDSPRSYVIVVDTSGSMLWSVKGKTVSISPENPRRIDAVKPPLITGIEALPDGTPLTLIEFSTGVKNVESFLLDRPEAREAATRWVRDLSPDPKGDTHLWAATRRSFEVMRAYLEQARTGRLPGRVLVRIYTDGENDDRSPETGDLTLQEVLADFPEIDGRTLRPDLVLMGPDLKMETEAVLKAEPRIRVIRDPGLVLPFPPVIVWRPDPIVTGQKASFLENSRSLYREYRWALDGNAVSREKVLDLPSLTSGDHTVRLEVTHESGLVDFSEENFSVIDPPAPLPEASFTLAPDVIVRPGTAVTAKADRTDPGWTHRWRVSGFPDREGPSITWEVTAPGRIDIVHEVSNASGAREYRQTLVCEAPELPSPEFEVPGGVEFIPGETLEFRAIATAPDWKHEWRIGNHPATAEAQAQAKLAETTPVEVTHRVTSSAGSRESKAVLQPVLPVLSADREHGTVPLEVNFSLSPGNVRKVVWDLAGQPSEGTPTLTHVFSEAGEHSVRIVAIETSRGQMLPFSEAAPSVIITAGLPWTQGPMRWLLYGLAGLGALVFVSILWKKLRPRPLFGKLEWTYGTSTGTVVLAGKTRLVLSGIPQLAAAGWKPKHPYALINKGRPGLFHIVGGPRELELKKGKAVALEGLTLTRPAT